MTTEHTNDSVTAMEMESQKLKNMTASQTAIQVCKVTSIMSNFLSTGENTSWQNIFITQKIPPVLYAETHSHRHL